MKKAKFASALLAAAASLALGVVGMPMAFATTASYETTGATRFVFSDSGISTTEGDYTGYKVKNTALTINEAGTYTVSGSCADGSITVKKGTTGVTLVLDGLTLTSADTAPIACNKSTEVTIVAADGSVNALADAAANNDDNYPDNENAENAVIKCKDGSKVTLGGTGSLTVTANGKNGIKSGATTDTEGEAWMTIEDLTLAISAPVNDAINAEATLSVRSGQLTIDAADDAIHSDYTLNIGNTGTSGPTIAINSCYEGLEAATLNVYSGDITIQATDDCLNAANSDLTDFKFTMTISGGSINAYTTTGDGFDSNGDLTISGGTVVVWSANTADNQPLDADGTITISGGTVLAAGGSGGMGMNLNATQPYMIIGNTGMGGQPGQSGEQPAPPSEQQPGQSSGQPTPPSGPQPGQSGDQPGQGTQTSASVTAGSTIRIQDTDGNTLYSGTAPCNASYFVFSSPKLTSGSRYTLYAADTSVDSATAQTGTTSSNTPGGQPGGQPGSGEQPPEKPDDGEQPPAKPDNPDSTGTTGSSSTGTTGSTTGNTSGSTDSSDSSSTTTSSSASGTSSTDETTTTGENTDTAASNSTASSKKSRKTKSTSTDTDESSDSPSDTKQNKSRHNKADSSDENSAPQTGESSHTTLWIVLLVLSGGTLVASLILWKKNSID